MACDECDRLRKQVRELKEEIAEYEADTLDDSEDPMPMRLTQTFRIRPQSARILWAMMKKPGRVLSMDALAHASEYHGDTTNPNDRAFKQSTRTNISRIRRGLESRQIFGGVQNSYGRGFLLTKEAAVRIAEILA